MRNLDVNKHRAIVEQMEMLVATYQHQLFKFAYFRTGSFADAQDMVQTVYLNLYRQKEKSGNIKNPKAYLFKSLFNACNNRAKQKRTAYEIDEKAHQLADDEASSSSYKLALKEKYKTIDSLLKQIPADQAEIIRLKIVDELTFAEIATLFDEPLTTIKSRFKYGIDKLKNIVKSKNYYHELF